MQELCQSHSSLLGVLLSLLLVQREVILGVQKSNSCVDVHSKKATQLGSLDRQVCIFLVSGIGKGYCSRVRAFYCSVERGRINTQDNLSRVSGQSG